ncbi:MAG TPA: nucleotidyltransferase family protein [Pyrinomonadaceae bacterium]|nr:nucleotidyltransferase family protein [Pyrinomonadaceae bacterium]
MRNLGQIQQTLSARKPELASMFHVRSLAVFGSYARNEQQPDSDVDILVEFDAPVGVEFIDLANYLEDLLQMRVDLVSRNGIKLKYFSEIQPDLKYF